MRADYKPAGYGDVAPYLIVDGAAGTIDFLVQAFGAERMRRFDDETGRVRHAEVRLGDTVVMLADGVEGYPPQPTHVHVYLPDVDDAYRRALDAGAVSVQTPEQRGDPDRRGGVCDPGGTTWWISTQVG